MSNPDFDSPEQQYEVLFERAPLPMWVYDAESLRFLQVNEAAVRHYGYSREEFLGMTIKDIRPPEDLPRLAEFLARQPEEYTRAGLWRHVKKDGSTIQVEAFCMPCAFKGRPGVIVAVNDVTDKEETERFVKTLLQISNRLNATLDVEELMDMLVQEAIVLVNAESGCAGLRTPQGMVCRRYFQQGKPVPLEYCWPPGHGLPGWLIEHKVPYLTNDALADRQIVHELCEQFGVRTALCTPLLDARGEVIGFFELHNKKDREGFTGADLDRLATVSQIAAIALQNAMAYGKLRDAEKELRKSREELEQRVRARTRELSAALQKLGEESMRFRQLAEHIQGVFYLTDPDNRQMLYVSPAYEAIWGRSRESLYADPQSWANAVLPEDRERVRAAREKGSITGSFDEEFRISRSDGAVRWIRARGFPVRDETGAIYRVAGIAEDVTEMRKAQEELRLTNEKLRQLSVRLLAVREEERRRAAREIHDELGAMLTALKLDVSHCVQRLAPHLGSEERETIGKTIRAIDASIEAVRRIVTDLRPSILDDFGPWAAIEWLAERLLERTGIRCDVMIEPAAEKAVLDQERGTALFRIVQEALTNVVRHARASEVRVQAQLLSNLLVVEVCDNGDGIPGTQSGDAAGFGIASMSERARSLGGSLAVSGVPGQGTTVRIELPVRGNIASQNT